MFFSRAMRDLEAGDEETLRTGRPRGYDWRDLVRLTNCTCRNTTHTPDTHPPTLTQTNVKAAAAAVSLLLLYTHPYSPHDLSPSALHGVVCGVCFPIRNVKQKKKDNGRMMRGSSNVSWPRPRQADSYTQSPTFVLKLNKRVLKGRTLN